MTLTQTPTAGSYNIYRCGDIFQLKLFVKEHTNHPFLRTNLGSAQKQRDALILHAEQELITSLNNWVDLSFEKNNDEEYVINLPLTEVGYFEAKIGFKDKNNKIIWSPGKNTNIKVEPASTIVNNSIYSVFTRQFGPNKNKAFSQDEEAETIKLLDDKGYHVIPPSGTFRDVIKELDHIMDDMGFRILQLLPIHPTPTTYARMGRFGSPYAALDFFSVNPSLAEFDKRTTPLDQFIELIDEIHRRKGEIYIDIPVDHTGWASLLQKDHPEYFVKDDQGNFISPGAWGTVWEDLVKLDFSKKKVHHMMAKVFLYWCNQGVDGFRCDAGYMIPFDAWEYIIAKVRTQFPNTIFLLEGLGGPKEVTQHLLAEGTFSWAYSELFQNYSKEEITNYINGMFYTTQTKGGMLNFSETHDNNRLAAQSHTWSKMRNSLCALTAPAGGFGISNGVEFFAEEKISVHHACGLNWDNPENMTDLFKRLSIIFEVHPAFYADAKIEIIDHNSPDLFICKRTATEGSTVIIVINLNCEHDQSFTVTPYTESQLPLNDLISLKSIDTSFTLPAGEAYCLESGDFYLKKLQHYNPKTDNSRLALQRCSEMMLNIEKHINGFTPISSNFISKNIESFLNHPIDYCEKQGLSFAQIIQWNAESDYKRTVMINQQSVIIIENKESFNFTISYKRKNLHSGYAILKQDKTYFALIPISLESDHENIKYLDIQINTHQSNTARKTGKLALLPKGDHPSFKQAFSFKEVKEKDLYALCTNTSGTMAQVSGFWGKYNSKYDSFFAVNMNPEVPVDRTALLSRFRCWVVCEDFSHELGEKSQYSFVANGSDRATWSFKAPIGQGKYILLDLHLYLVKDKNQIFLTYSRRNDENQNNLLDKDAAVKIIIRPDIEYRSNHETTKALNGAEKEFPKSITSKDTGFSFTPYNQPTLKLNISNGTFHSEPEWEYMHYLPVEADRGLEAHTDLFSPGYFSCTIKEDENIYLSAYIDDVFNEIDKTAYSVIPLEENRDDVLKRSIEKFIVRRNDGLTVIAGYPWFLDWGRDTLICLRGIIAADMKQEAKDILFTFAKYEENGSLPNMIRGDNANNRDTSDAPLWFNVAVKDYIDHFNDSTILKMRCGKRTILQVINSIVDNYIKGTPNGIIMDEESGLIYSPPHFTWMDTNYPAGTPREGYPIEIQALWCATLKNIAHYTADEKWQQLALKVEQSILTYYPLEESGFADCLHTNKFKPAKNAKKDNVCRSNQIFLITLGVVKDSVLIKSLLLATQSLIMPGAIRSLKDAPITPPLAIYREGQLLNNPSHPYWGNYCGDEDTRRKPAYHNGTGWAWPFFSYCEALYIYTKDKENSLSVLMSAKQEMSKGIINHLPEICDGNTPHLQRGCKAQAWSITEYYRVLKKITP